MPTYPTYKLGEICETTSGGTPNRKNDAYYGGIIPWVKSGELGKGIIYDTEEKITEQAVKESSAKIFPKGTLLIALYGATIGKLGFLGVPAATNQAVCGIFENEKIDLQFLSYYLFHKRNDLIAQGTGGAQPNISQTILKNLSIPLPPLATQHLIVSRIETLFAELDKAAEHLRTAQQQLKTYKQAVLRDAFEGCENAEKHLFGELMADVRNGYGAKPTNCGTNKLLRISSVRAMNLNLDDFRFNNSSFDERDIIQENDLLFTRYNGSVDLVGVCAYVPELYDTYAYPDKIIRCRPKVCNTFHSKFLQYYINQGKAREFVRSKIKTTSGQNGISGSDIKKIEIPLPLLIEQHRIVKEIESRLSQAEAAEASIAEALHKTEALRQSILKKAFSGELV
ncbi:MAG: restriction endonuclease subunit S [Bacteroidales bacterium]|nr:restriction endonuclease subunit S [Bacteroidales bacterium]